MLKLLVFAAWLRLALRGSKNTDHPFRAGLSRLAILAGFGVGAVTI